ncbi:MAG TPA: chorismate-binding protein, partial [Anaerolineales bacterium]|nr:chorismate-binding protein [Anaerolineales bacterium]
MDKIKPQIGRVHQNEALLKDDMAWLHFTDPHRVILAGSLEEVIPALREVECLVRENQWHAAGFLSYEAASAFDSVLVTRSIAEHSAQEFPYLWFGLYPHPRRVSLPKPEGTKENSEWQPTICRETYNGAIEKIKENIAEGRTYQVNYTMRLESPFMGDPWEFFLYLAQSQNRHGAYIDTGQYVISSASPELFFRLDGSTVTCRPMKGTTPRGRTTAEDREQSEWLRASAKNRAENVMIVDMIRNDLG